VIQAVAKNGLRHYINNDGESEVVFVVGEKLRLSFHFCKGKFEDWFGGPVNDSLVLHLLSDVMS